ncbi:MULTISPECIES: hypothetical protein [unclassified Streptomyces]|uniref:hypothetical protein n=1 Tax=unclassified Streptomyces TaxID=2593676 RepID=UPI00031439AE|nr:hypothetical protein [Streptomyces sp. e14]
MLAPALLSALSAAGLEQIVQWKYGTWGFVGLLLFSVGVKARNPAVGFAGAVVLLTLFAGSVR